MRIGVLGALEVQDDHGGVVAVPGARLRALLIGLALEPGRWVSVGRLVDGIWGAEPPAGAANALQALVSRLRKALPDAVIESGPAGYRLVIEPEAVDATRFEYLVARDDHAAALALWRGPALADVAETEVFQPVIARLTELRLAALEARVEADLRVGRGAERLGELTALVAEHPLRERLVGALMRALTAAGRPAEALTVFEKTRQALAEALGTDPSPELSALHTSLLRGELPHDRRPRTNLRAGLTSFVGRDEDVARVGKLVGEYRLTTLTGPGGSGKTRLAVEAARTLEGTLPDGVWLVELAPVTEGSGVAQSVLTALGLREQSVTARESAGDPADALALVLGTWQALIVLDNCEHVIDAVAALADRLLGECPRLRVLATSREPLGITGEALWPVEPLALPPEEAGLADAMSYPAVRLLADRAAAVRPGFAIIEGTVPAVIRICRALDGMPLAIELAAARLRTLSAEQLAGRLDERFRLLTGGARTVLPRHQTLRAVVDWSWELLSEPERVLLRRLAVFAGGATAEAAERVCAEDRALELLDALADKSLLVMAGDRRYRMLETIRAYCLDRLDEAGERDRLRVAHASYFAGLAETADPHLRRAEQLIWLNRLAADRDNINSALRAAIAAGDARNAVRLVAAAGWYWWLAGHKAEGAELTAAALAVPGPADTEHLALACGISVLFGTTGLGDERDVQDMLRRARQLARESGSQHPLLRFLEPLEELVQHATGGTDLPPRGLDRLLDDPDPWMRAQARLNRARLLVSSGGHAEAEIDARAGLAEFQAVGERWGIAFAHTTLADLLAQRGDLAGALDHYDEAIGVVTEIATVEDVLWMRSRQAQLRLAMGDQAGSAAAIAAAERDAELVGWPDALAGLAAAKAALARCQGDLDTARVELTRAEALMRNISVHPVFRAMILDTRAYVASMADDLESARTHRAEALALAVSSAHAPTIAAIVVGVADLALRQGRPGEAARLLAASVAVRGGPDLSNLDAARVENAARAALGDLEFAEAARAGEHATRTTVAELAAVTLSG